MKTDSFTLAGREFSSRILMGTGKFESPEVMAASLDASGCEIVTVALRRVDIDSPETDILTCIDREKYLLLPNTSGARNAIEAVRLAHLARNAGLSDWIKVEVTPEPRYLMPDPVETLKACEILVKEGFVVLPYIHADPVLAQKLTDIGTSAVMPLAAPIGTNKGLTMRYPIQIIIEQARVPVIIDAGLGLPSDAALSMELGADAILLNTAIATAKDSVEMSHAFRLCVEAGRRGYLSGPGPQTTTAQASSPLTGFLEDL